MCVIIPVSSPYFEVRMDTSGLYALVKVRTIFPESAHPHNIQVTRTLYTSRTGLTSTVYAPNLRAQFTRHVQYLQAYFTHVQFMPPPTRTINASKLHVQSTRPTYAYNLRLSLARTYLTLHWSTYGYFRTVRNCKSTYDISVICTLTRHTGHTHTLHVTYTIDQHSLRA